MFKVTWLAVAGLEGELGTPESGPVFSVSLWCLKSEGTGLGSHSSRDADGQERQRFLV